MKTHQNLTPKKQFKMDAFGNLNAANWTLALLICFIALFFLGFLPSCKVVKTNISSAETNKATVYYYLPQSVIKIIANSKVAVVYDASDNTLTGSSNVVEQTFTMTTEHVADTRNLLMLNYAPSVLSSDELKYGVNSKGLLETVEVTTDDRTAEIVAKLAEAPKVILSASAGAPRGAGVIVKIKEYSNEFFIRASDLSNADLEIPWTIVLQNELGVDESPITVDAMFKVSTPGRIAPSSTTLKDKLGDFQKNNEVKGLITRPLINIPVVIKASTSGFTNAFPIDLPIIDVEKIVVIPVNRTAFVKRVNKIGITNGVITSHEINKPSSFEGFVSIPVNVAKAIVSIPGQLIQFKYDNTRRLEEYEKAKLDLERAISEKQKFVTTKEQELNQVKLDLEKSQIKHDYEIEKFRLEMQKALLDAEKDQIESEKALDALKAEIAKLKNKK